MHRAINTHIYIISAAGNSYNTMDIVVMMQRTAVMTLIMGVTVAVVQMQKVRLQYRFIIIFHTGFVGGIGKQLFMY